jgi:hypothetical protein
MRDATVSDIYATQEADACWRTIIAKLRGIASRNDRPQDAEDLVSKQCLRPFWL